MAAMHCGSIEGSEKAGLQTWSLKVIVMTLGKRGVG